MPTAYEALAANLALKGHTMINLGPKTARNVMVALIRMKKDSLPVNLAYLGHLQTLTEVIIVQSATLGE